MCCTSGYCICWGKGVYGTDKITTEEVMDKLDIFQYILVKIDKFGWWDL